MGLRLPLDSLPWVARDGLSLRSDRGPLAAAARPAERISLSAAICRSAAATARFPARRRPPAGDGPASAANDSDRRSLRRGRGGIPGDAPPPGARRIAPLDRAHGALRRAARGRLHVFMPPVARAGGLPGSRGRRRRRPPALDLPVIIEGYPPPLDPRLNSPQGHARSRGDRGEHPPEQILGRDGRAHRTVLYEEARQTRLGTEKFMLDGRHTGTGGGNHIVLGGATPSRQPAAAPARFAALACWPTGRTTRR